MTKKATPTTFTSGYFSTYHTLTAGHWEC